MAEEGVSIWVRGHVVTICFCRSFMAVEVEEKGSAECFQMSMAKVFGKSKGMD